MSIEKSIFFKIIHSAFKVCNEGVLQEQFWLDTLLDTTDDWCQSRKESNHSSGLRCFSQRHCCRTTFIMPSPLRFKCMCACVMTEKWHNVFHWCRVLWKWFFTSWPFCLMTVTKFSSLNSCACSKAVNCIHCLSFAEWFYCYSHVMKLFVIC